MAKNENIDEILLELNKTLSKLTGKELKVATVEFKAPTKEQLAAAAAAAQKKQDEEKKKTAEKQPEKTAPAQGGQTEKPAEKKPEPVPQKMLSPHDEKPAQGVQAEANTAKVTASPEPAPKAVEAAPKAAEAQPPAKKEAPKSNIPSDIDPGQVLRILCFHPAGSPDLAEAFFTNLEDVLHKTTKKKFYIVKETAEATDYSANDIKTASVMSKDMNADAVMFISKEAVEIEFTSLYSRVITAEQVKKRFFYVDLVVEIVLAKKK